MKKITLSFLIILLLIISGFVFVEKQTKPENPKPEIALCFSSSSFVEGVAFQPISNLAMPLIRKNIYTLTSLEINSIKTGVAAMKALPFNDPTSWIYQAAIHRTTRTENLPSWNACHQPGDGFFFLAWHRMYVYFFERILRSKAGNPNLTIPYWDYTTNAKLHPDYRNNSTANSLYDATRNNTINAGGDMAVAGITRGINDAQAKLPYYDFQNDINAPHGSVHGAIGGNMGNVSTAGLDPAFWLHHSNIDRLWEQWLRMCHGRVNPVEDRWLSKTYTFFDENGAAVNMSGRQVVNTATQLGYLYDLPPSISCNFVKLNLVAYRRWKFLDLALPVALRQPITKIKFKLDNSKRIELFQKENNKLFNMKDKSAPDEVFIEIGNAEIKKAPDGVVEIYLNLRANEKPNPKSKSFVGVLDLFHAQHLSEHKGMDALTVNATNAAKALNLTLADLGKSEVTFIVRGNRLNGEEIKTESDIVLSDIQFSVAVAKSEN